MHEIEKILRKHFTPDELEFMALNKEIDDWQWLSDLWSKTKKNYLVGIMNIQKKVRNTQKNARSE